MSEENQPLALNKSMIVVLFGDAQAGKSSIVRSLTKPASFDEKYIGTIGAIHNDRHVTGEFRGHDLKYKQHIWDTGGNPRTRNLTEIYFKGADAFVFVVDGTQPLNKENAKSWFEAAKARPSLNAKFYIAVNKCDEQLHPDFQSETALTDIKNIAKGANIDLAEDAVFRCSAKDGTNIQPLFDKVAHDWDHLTQLDLQKDTHKVLISRERAAPSPSWSTFRKVLVGGNVVAGLGGVALLVAAAFAVGGFLTFLTFGILPSAFIGAAIITAVAFAAWNIGCGIYYAYERNAVKGAFLYNTDLDEPPVGWTKIVRGRENQKEHEQQEIVEVNPPVITQPGDGSESILTSSSTTKVPAKTQANKPPSQLT